MIDSNHGLEAIPNLPEWARPFAESARVPKRTASRARLFTLTWDNSRNRKHPSKRDSEQRQCQGVYWPGEPCQVALSTGNCFESMGELAAAFALAGNYQIDWEGSDVRG